MPPHDYMRSNSKFFKDEIGLTKCKVSYLWKSKVLTKMIRQFYYGQDYQDQYNFSDIDTQPNELVEMLTHKYSGLTTIKILTELRHDIIKLDK